MTDRKHTQSSSLPDPEALIPDNPFPAMETAFGMKNNSIDKKHTPGLWFVPDQTWARDLTVEVDNLIACPGSGGAMYYTTTICTLGWSGTPEWDAYARLIAAAPDLLEALEWCIRALEYDYTGIAPDCEIPDDIRAAIAKAKGQAND